MSFDDGNAPGAGISFDSGYQSADTEDGTDGFTQDGSAISGSQESGILQMADAQGISGNENGMNAGLSGIESGAGRSVMTTEARSSVVSQTGVAGSLEPGSGDGGIQAAGGGQGVPGQPAGVTMSQNYQQLERDGVKYARFAADGYEKPSTPHRVVEADGKRFYEVKLEPVQAGIKATLQKDGKVHYEKTYKEVLPEVPKKKQKAVPKKENASGNRTKGKNNPKKNRGRWEA